MHSPLAVLEKADRRTDGQTESIIAIVQRSARQTMLTRRKKHRRCMHAVDTATRGTCTCRPKTQLYHSVLQMRHTNLHFTLLYSEMSPEVCRPGPTPSMAACL